MEALQIFLIAMYGLSILLNIAMIGKPRKPSTPGTVAISTLVSAGIMAWIIFGWPS